jgi:hypothetical protein
MPCLAYGFDRQVDGFPNRHGVNIVEIFFLYIAPLRKRWTGLAVDEGIAAMFTGAKQFLQVRGVPIKRWPTGD